jgi:hypothetical protein
MAGKPSALSLMFACRMKTIININRKQARNEGSPEPSPPLPPRRGSNRRLERDKVTPERPQPRRQVFVELPASRRRSPRGAESSRHGGMPFLCVLSLVRFLTCLAARRGAQSATVRERKPSPSPSPPPYPHADPPTQQQFDVALKVLDPDTTFAYGETVSWARTIAITRVKHSRSAALDILQAPAACRKRFGQRLIDAANAAVRAA